MGTSSWVELLARSLAIEEMAKLYSSGRRSIGRNEFREILKASYERALPKRTSA